MFRTLKKMMKATPYTKSAIADGLPSARESTDIVLEECRQRFSLGDLDGAEKAARAILVMSSEIGEAWYHLGLIAHRRGDNIGALEMLRKAVDLSPHHAEAQNHYGNALRVQGRFHEALEMYSRASVLKSGYAAPLYNMGLIHTALGQPIKAESFFQKALEIDPAFSAVLISLGVVRLDQEKYREAKELFRKALLKNPESLEALNNLWIALVMLKRCEEALEVCNTAVAIAPNCAEVHNTLGLALRDSGRLDEAIASYRRALEINPECLGAINNLGSSLRETGHLREAIAAPRGALVYAFAWLGYPGTTGLAAIEYRFSDDIADQEVESDLYHAETVSRLPGAFHCYTLSADAPEVAQLPSASSGRITFGSLNKISKITKEVAALWCDLLSWVPGSRLIIKNHSLTDKATRSRYESLIGNKGISPDRVEQRPWVNENGSYLAVYGEIDIALDTFPYNGTTTTCEALWMGFPVVTLAGERHAGRVGASTLSRVGLSDLVAVSLEAYLRATESLARDMGRLSRIGNTLRQTMLSSAFCNVAGFAASIENEYRLFWRKWCVDCSNFPS